jgi:2-polyprenyl-3-methyl-5-hydroxy-6-metoxy-1,4-benzoquinol methylase
MSEDRFADLDFERFRELARDESLTPRERVGFPGTVRQGKETAIFEDVRLKLPSLELEGQAILDIGAGCSELTELLIAQCETRGHNLTLVDSEEMLRRLPSGPRVTLLFGCFPRDCAELLRTGAGRFDAILVYSVIQYVFAEANLFSFLDAAAGLLAPGGRMLVGDIPNASMRRRFLGSEAGRRFHRDYMKTDAPPDLRYDELDPGAIDDAVLTSLLLRYRSAGLHAYVLPQGTDLPMANRREDLVLHRP